METKFKEPFLGEVANHLQRIYGSNMEVSVAMCCANGLEVTGVIGRLPDRRIVPVVYLEDIPARASAEKAAYIITRKIHAMLTDRPVKPVRKSRGSERQAILADVVLQAASKRASCLMQHNHVHFCQGDIVGLFHLRSRRVYLTKDELEEQQIGLDELLGAACKNTLAQFGITLVNTSEFARSLPGDTLLQSEPFSSVRFDPQCLYLLTNDAPTSGAVLMLMPPVLKALGRMVGGDYYITPKSTQEVMISSAVSMFSPKMLASFLGKENQETEEEQERLSDYIFRYDCAAEKLILIQQ